MDHTPSSAAPPIRDWSVAAAAAATLLAAVLRFWNVTFDSLWMDEAASWRQASLGFVDMLRATAWDNYPPVHNVALFVSLRLFGDGEVAVRLPSVVFGILTVPAVFLAGRELFGRLAGVAAAVLVATAQFQIYYSQEARMYSAFALFAALSLYFMLLHLRRPSWLSAIGFVLATATMLYTHFYALFTIGVEGLFVLGLLIVRRAGWRPVLHWLVLFATAVILFVPWVHFLIRQTLHVQEGFWIREPTYDRALEFFRTFAGSTKLVLAELALVFLALMLTLRPPRLDAPQPAPHGVALRYGDRIVLMAAWILLPILLAYGLSFVVQPFLMVRYVIAASLAWYILAAAGLAVMGRENALAGMAIAAILIAGGVASLSEFYSAHHRGDWRAVVAHVSASKQPGDVVIANPVGNRAVVNYYMRRDPAPVGVYNGYNFEIADAASRVWLVTDMWDECISGKPGELSARRPLIEHKSFYASAVCLYGPLRVSGQ